MGLKLAKGTIGKIVKQQDDIKNVSAAMTTKQRKSAARIQLRGYFPSWMQPYSSGSIK